MMPHILPMEQITDLAEIAELCKESKEPVFLTKEGAGELVVLDMKSYERLMKQENEKEEEDMDSLDLLISLQKEIENEQ